MEEKIAVIEVAEDVFTNEIAEVKSKEIKVTDDASNDYAGKYLVDLKSNMKKIVDYFAPLKTAAHKAHKAITSREAEALEPFKKKEMEIKIEMSRYHMEQERKRREAEEVLRKQIEEEKRRAMAEAEKLEKEGKSEESEMALQQAIDAEEMSMFAKVEVEKTAIKGIVTQKDYIVTISDELKVPAYIMGACIRPVDLATIKKLVKNTDGKIKIDGIHIEETVIIKAGGR